MKATVTVSYNDNNEKREEDSIQTILLKPHQRYPGILKDLKNQ